MTDRTSSPGILDDAGKLLARVTLAVLMLLHGTMKLERGLSGVRAMLTQKGLPTFLAWGVYVGELLAPLLLLLGIATRPAAGILAFNMLMATYLVHSGDVLRRNTTGGWAIELQAFYFVLSVLILLQGSGRFALSRGKGRWD